MNRQIASVLNIEVSGMAMSSFIKAFRLFPGVLTKYLIKYGISRDEQSASIEPGAWYPLSGWIALTKAVEREVGPNSLFAVGQNVPGLAAYTPELQDQLSTIEGAMRVLDVGYHMNHRKNGVRMFNPANGQMLEGIGHYGVQRTEGQRHAMAIFDNPYPCDFDRGILTAAVKISEPRAKVTHSGTSCRKRYDPCCTYAITW
jgi:hypothetical protein